MSGNSKLQLPHGRICVLLLLILLGIVYLPFLGNPLVFDDVPFFKSIAQFSDGPFKFNFRWFPYSSLGFTWVFFREDPLVFRLQNLFLHAFNALLLLLLLRVWISIFVADVSKEKMANWGAWLGAMIFACHPLAVYGVGYLVQRSILMATLFTLVMQLAYLRGLLENNKKYLALAVAAYFLAAFSKEHSLLAPAILLPLTWLMREHAQKLTRALWITWIGFALVALLVMLGVKGLLGAVYEVDASNFLGQMEVPNLYLLSVLTQAGLFFKYCLLMLLPNPAWMSIDMRETFLLSDREWTSWIGLLAFVVYGLCALRCLFRGGRIALLGLAMLYPWLYFMTEFASIRVQDSFVLYRSYLWLPGVMLLLPLLVSVLPDKKMVLPGALIILLFVPLAWNRLWVFGDDFRLWDDAVKLLHEEDRLGAQRTYYNRAHAAAVLKNWPVAISDYRKSISIDSSHLQVYLALASAYSGAKRYTEALSVYDKMIEMDEKNATAYLRKGFVLNMLNDKEGAANSMKRSCELGEKTACNFVKLNQSNKH